MIEESHIWLLYEILYVGMELWSSDDESER